MDPVNKKKQRQVKPFKHQILLFSCQVLCTLHILFLFATQKHISNVGGPKTFNPQKLLTDPKECRRRWQVDSERYAQMSQAGW